MRLILYSTPSLPNTLSKTLNVVEDFGDVQLPNDTRDDEVTVQIERRAQSITPVTVNYMRLGDAYYYVTSVEYLADGLVTVTGRIDVLQTYRTSIRNLVVFADRSTNRGSMEIADRSRKFSARKNRTVIPFPNQISEERLDGSFVLVTAQKYYGAAG